MCKLVEVMTNDGRVCKVADIKKDYIENIIRNADICAAIDEIILFGSAIEERCTEESDIDIAIMGRKTRTQILTSKSYRDFARRIYQFGKFQNYDLLYFRNDRKVKDRIFDDISRGEVIYRKEREVNGE